MKYVKILCLSIGLISMVSIFSCGSLSQKKIENDYVVLRNNDTVYGKRIKLSRGYNQLGKVEVVKQNSVNEIYDYDEVFQVFRYRNNGSYYQEEMVMLTPGNPISYTLMDIVINNGSIKLYEHDPTGWGNTPFVVSKEYHGYVRTKKEYENFLNSLKKCDAFVANYNEKQSLKETIELYHTYCN